jgi:hypothetical protein
MHGVTPVSYRDKGHQELICYFIIIYFKYELSSHPHELISCNQIMSGYQTYFPDTSHYEIAPASKSFQIQGATCECDWTGARLRSLRFGFTCESPAAISFGAMSGRKWDTMRSVVDYLKCC